MPDRLRKPSGVSPLWRRLSRGACRRLAGPRSEPSQEPPHPLVHAPTGFDWLWIALLLCLAAVYLGALWLTARWILRWLFAS